MKKSYTNEFLSSLFDVASKARDYGLLDLLSEDYKNFIEFTLDIWELGVNLLFDLCDDKIKKAEDFIIDKSKKSYKKIMKTKEKIESSK